MNLPPLFFQKMGPQETKVRSTWKHIPRRHSQKQRDCTLCTRWAVGPVLHWPAILSMQTQNSLADLIEQTGHALTANELASLLAVSHVTVFKQAKAGRIPSFRIGTCVRFDPVLVAKWLRTM